MARREHLRNGVGAFGLLINGELVRPDRLVFVNAGLHVPARKVAAIRARKSSRAEATNRSALPVSIIDHAGKRRFSSARIFQRLADSALPGNFGNRVAPKSGQRGNETPDQ